jgi:SAM-dependent methyltransferase
MEDIFPHLSDLENSFWCTSRDELLLEWVKDSPVLDVGCGVGGMTKRLLRKGFRVYSLDSNKRAYEAVSKVNPNTTCADITEVNEEDYPKFKTAIILDVLEHIQDDRKALVKVNRMLEDDGRVIISVPYHRLLWNKTDKYHYRRYSRKELRGLLEETGFTVEKMRFWNMLSLMPLLISKIFGFELSHHRIAHSPLNALLRWYFERIENKVPVPLGSQLFCLARKRT